MAGFLIPPWYKDEQPSTTEFNVACIIWGISLATTFFTGTKASQQTWRVWKRTRSLNLYIILVITELVSNTVLGVVSWLFLDGAAAPSFQLFFGILTLWVFQTQCIMQIIVNRIAIINPNTRTVKRLRWGTFAAILVLNISVYTIWLPARLQISPLWIHINEVWDRIEKVFFLLIDAGLSSYFAYLVRTRLVANGMLKYNRLFRWNVIMILFSVSLDILLIGVISLGHGFVYVQFHPLVYLLKLQIELNITDLLAKIVRLDEGAHRGSSGPATGPKPPHDRASKGASRHFKMQTLISTHRGADKDAEGEFKGGIQKTIETEIRYNKDDSDAASRASSTRELNSPFDFK
ncbi:hypothetical protein GGR57DRAFT_396445 [Xylariaceae sp. FL1272]|nr:hypothetical protein GGR57DRAFT_396445 [Xylariaceae sp. FL1272]